MLDFVQDIFKNGLPQPVLWLIGAVLLVYLLSAVWSRLSWQNLVGSNQVDLPHLARPANVPKSGTEGATIEQEVSGKVLVIGRGGEGGPERPEREHGLIYPLAGRNGLYFAPSRCSSCGLCVYVCPTGAVTTHASGTAAHYSRRFDLAACIYCGMCESACPTQAIKLTLNEPAAQSDLAKAVVQGEVRAGVCGQCHRPVPQADLLADRIYNFGPTIGLGKTSGNKRSGPSESDQQERDTRLVQPETPCPACQQRVLKAEEEICK